MPPLYYQNGTAAMLYAGLGFLYARVLLKAMDTASHLHAMSQKHLTVARKADRLAQMLECISSKENFDDVFPSLPALEVAHAAFIQALNGTHDQRLIGLEAFSGEQVFFMTTCLSLCEEGSAGQPSSAACNAAARNYAPFAAAFRCSNGSAMNPAAKCRFFGMGEQLTPAAVITSAVASAPSYQSSRVSASLCSIALVAYRQRR
ncbi:uncharacterized protein LOC144129349 [Amblyomma americanum]